jgi:hypothetical protein
MDSMKHEHEPWSMNIKHGNMGMKHWSMSMSMKYEAWAWTWETWWKHEHGHETWAC